MSEEARPMTPTEEEAELARVMSEAEGNGSEQDKLYHNIARAILSAGYVKRNDALEEAAKVADGFQNEMAARFTPEMSEATKTDRLSQSEAARSIAARIRALKAKT